MNTCERVETSTVNAAELAGSINIFDPLVGRTLYKRLTEAMAEISEPGVLAIDFEDISLVDISAVLISVAKLLVFSRRNDWEKTAVCLNVTPSQMHCLNKAVIISPDVFYWQEASASRILLLASNRVLNADDKRIWHLLGEVDDSEVELWQLIQGQKSVDPDWIGRQLASDSKAAISELQVFIENKLILASSRKGKLSLCSVLMYLDLGPWSAR